MEEKERKETIDRLLKKACNESSKNLLRQNEKLNDRYKETVRARKAVNIFAGLALLILGFIGVIKTFQNEPKTALLCCATGAVVYIICYITTISDAVENIAMETSIFRNIKMISLAMENECASKDDDDDDDDDDEEEEDEEEEEGETKVIIKPKHNAPKLKHNAFRCKKCGMIVESKSVHNFQSCKCGNFTDGGLEYMRRGGNLDDMEDVSGDEEWAAAWEDAKEMMKIEEDKNGKL